MFVGMLQKYKIIGPSYLVKFFNIRNFSFVIVYYSNSKTIFIFSFLHFFCDIIATMLMINLSIQQ